MIQVLADNDALVKLVHCNLIDESLNAFHYDARFSVVPTFKYWVAGKAKKRYRPEVVTKLTELDTKIIDGESFDESANCLQGVAAIDPGELLLIGAACALPNSVILTGDKRAIRARAAADGYPVLQPKLIGKIVIVEQVILALIEKQGFEFVRDRVCGSNDGDLSFDTSLMAAFSGGTDPTETECRSCLVAYIEDLRKDVSDLLSSIA